MPSHPHVPGCARLNLGRLNAFRLNDVEQATFALIGGINRSQNVRIEGAAVEHVLNDAPDTASVRVDGFVPIAGQPFALYVGDFSPERQLFGGRILQTTQLYESRRQNVAHDIQAIDPTWLMNRTRVLATYSNASATGIIHDVIVRFTHGITEAHVAPNLPIIDAITFTNENVASCLTAICERIGAYWYLDYTDDLHVFFNESPDATPITDAQPQGASDFQLSEDLSQVVTRVIARGGGGSAVIDVPPGATEIPIDDDAWYGTSGGLVEVAVSAQRIPYSGVRGRGGVGAIIGTGNAPSVAPVPTPAGGSSHTVGATYQYAVSFTTASGETLPGPLGAITIKNLPFVPPPALSARSRGPGSYPPGMISAAGGPIRFAVQIVYNGNAWGPLGTPTAAYTWDGNDWEVYVGPTANYLDGFYYPVLEPNGPVATVNHFIVYRSDNYQPWQYATSSGFVSPTYWVYQCCAGYSTGQVPAATGYGSVIVKQVPLSTAAGVTGRKLYRTAANGSALNLLTTLANNTATDYGDTVSDAALGAAPPSTDTSTIRADGEVLAGATTIPVSNTGPFGPELPGDVGGWAQVGNLVIRYTGLGTGTLTGVPASGPGALTATVRYGAQILVQPRLVGIQNSPAAIQRAIHAGEAVTIRVEVDDAAAQAALGARLGGGPSEGIVEEVFSDSRMTFPELLNYAKALLADRKDPRQTLRFVSRDPSLQVGRLVALNVATPPINAAFRIQRIVFDEIAITGGLSRTLPRRTVEASNKLYTFADLLRRLRGREGGAN